jgi:hypothetical protein
MDESPYETIVERDDIPGAVCPPSDERPYETIDERDDTP